MTIYRLKTSVTIAAVMSFLGANATIANAQLIAADSYRIGTAPAAGEYANSTSLASQATVTVAGFTNSLAGTGTAQFQSTSLGLNNAAIGATSATSGKVNYLAPAVDAAATNRSTARSLTTPVPTATTYYFSHLVNRGAVTSTPIGNGRNRDFVGVGFSNTVTPTIGTTGLTGIYVGFSGDTGSLVLRYRDTASTNVAETSLIAAVGNNIDNTTYLVVAQVDVNTNGANDTVTYYVNPTDFTSNATLASTSLITGSFQANILSASSDIQRLTYFSRDFNSGAFFDEARLGAGGTGISPAAALGLNIATAPEPGSLLLVLLGGITSVGIRKRRI